VSIRRVAASLVLAGIVGIGTVSCSSSGSHDNSDAVTNLDKLGPEVAKLRLEVEQLRQEVQALQQTLSQLQPSGSDTTTTTSTLPAG
jgi:outer membrane murein-binding lipoprotein Lpp